MLMKSKLAFVVTSRRLLRADKLLANLLAGRYHLCTPEEWRYLLSGKQSLLEDILPVLTQWELLDISWENFVGRCTALL